MSFDREWIIGQREAIVAAFLLKGGILDATSKEVVECLTKVHDSHLHGVFGDFQHPRE